MSAGDRTPAEDFSSLLDASSRAWSLALPQTDRAALAAYLSELDEWRRRINLTGRLARGDLVLHTAESIQGAGLISHDARVIDIGSGAGFPALPLAIVRRNADFTLVEARSRKAAFLRHAIRTLGLSNATVIARDLRDMPSGAWKVATSRAVGDIWRLADRAPALQSVETLLLWTTDPEQLSRDLNPRFRLDATLPLSSSDRGVIARFRRN
jgi:16S rRNA (guanine527-N7)-methyltransferase